MFDLEVENIRADFEIYLKDYNSATKELTFEILNIAEIDVKAINIEIPKQENAEVVGAKTNIVGDLDSNKYTTANFKANLKEGEIKLNISYSDERAIRRTIQESIYFDPSYFNQATTQENNSWYFYLILILISFGILFYVYKKFKKKKDYSQRRSQIKLRD